MTRNGQLCHIVGVHRSDCGSIAHVVIETLESTVGTADHQLITGVNPHDLATENSRAEVFDAIASVEGVEISRDNNGRLQWMV